MNTGLELVKKPVFGVAGPPVWQIASLLAQLYD